MDEDLVVQAPHRDRRAFESLAIGHHTRLYRVAMSILRDRHGRIDFGRGGEHGFLDPIEFDLDSGEPD